mmetsp:Transcript_28587/g.61462  ORF Transcript_28587/g.61462 Transcript_28587/m.61462 type:complete len:267 (+) Transcript_28587:749-1549(+)
MACITTSMAPAFANSTLFSSSPTHRFRNDTRAWACTPTSMGLTTMLTTTVSHPPQFRIRTRAASCTARFARTAHPCSCSPQFSTFWLMAFTASSIISVPRAKSRFSRGMHKLLRASKHPSRTMTSSSNSFMASTRASIPPAWPMAICKSSPAALAMNSTLHAFVWAMASFPHCPIALTITSNPQLSAHSSNNSTFGSCTRLNACNPSLFTVALIEFINMIFTMSKNDMSLFEFNVWRACRSSIERRRMGDARSPPPPPSLSESPLT